jgi:hypothetical protein
MNMPAECSTAITAAFVALRESLRMNVIAEESKLKRHRII